MSARSLRSAALLIAALHEAATQKAIYCQPYVTDRPPSAAIIYPRNLRAVTMFGRGVWFALGIFAFAAANSASAQGSLDQGKTGPQLFASACATCHKSPQSVSKTKWFFGLESFLRQHYTSSRESAAILAAYLKGQEKLSTDPPRGHAAKQISQAKPSEPAPSDIGEDIPRPPADIPDVKR